MNNNLIETNNDDKLFRDIILLYCPEKVGSTSLCTSIRTCASDKFIVFHSHSSEIFKINNNNQMIIVNYSDIVKNTQIINKKTGTNRKIYIIDIYRTPIERKISSYFQRIAELHFNKTENDLLKYPIDLIIKRFNNIYTHFDEIDYFNERFEIPKINSFDFEKKYIKYEKDNVVYIKLRLKDFDKWGEIMSEILNTEIIMIKDYSTENKIIGPVYKLFKSNYKLPINYYNLLTACDYLKKYYTIEERMEYLDFWEKNTSPFHIGFNLQEYFIYNLISKENCFYKINCNDHYGDDGCICLNCKKQRKKIFSNLKQNLKKINNTFIKHKMDKKYDSFLLLRLFNEKEENYSDIIVNYFNFF
jgi:nicotinamide riboside kinase